ERALDEVSGRRFATDDFEHQVDVFVPEDALGIVGQPAWFALRHTLFLQILDQHVHYLKRRAHALREGLPIFLKQAEDTAADRPAAQQRNPYRVLSLRAHFCPTFEPVTDAV